MTSIATAPSIQPESSPASQRRKIVTAWQHGDTRASGDGELEHEVGQPAARVARHHDVRRLNLHIVQCAGHERDAARQPRPCAHERVVHARARGRQRLVHDQRARRGVVQDEHDLREQTMAGAEVDDAAAAKEPPRASSHLPRLVQLLARQAARVADGSGQTIEERGARKTTEVLVGQPAAGGRGEGHCSKAIASRRRSSFAPEGGSRQ